MAILNANDLRLFAIDGDGTGTRIQMAHSQTVSLDISNSLIDITTKDSNSWMDKISGQRSFSVSADGLLDYGTTSGQNNTITIADYAVAGTELFFSFGIDSNTGTPGTPDRQPETGDILYRGSGFLSSFGQSGGTDDAPTYSISLDGDGALERFTSA